MTQLMRNSPAGHSGQLFELIDNEVKNGNA
jgi:hypothetical protein